MLSGLSVELGLFWSSYAPLFLLLAIRFTAPWLEVVCALLAAGGFAAGLVVARVYPREPGRSWVATTAEDRGGEVAGYVATYLTPFVLSPDPGWRDIVAYVLFLALLAVIH